MTDARRDGLYPTPVRTFTNSDGRTFAVRIVPPGARYGRANVLTNDGPVMAEFYDTTTADDGDGDFRPGGRGGFGPLGQFVSRYNVPTLLGTDRYGTGTGGLCLDGGANARVWRVDGDTMSAVREWLRTSTTTPTTGE